MITFSFSCFCINSLKIKTVFAVHLCSMLQQKFFHRAKKFVQRDIKKSKKKDDEIADEKKPGKEDTKKSSKDDDRDKKAQKDEDKKSSKEDDKVTFFVF